MVFKSRSALTSLEYFSDLSALVSVTIADIFCITGSVREVASCVVPSVLFTEKPFGKDDSLLASRYCGHRYP